MNSEIVIKYNSYNAKLVRVIACISVMVTHLGGYVIHNEFLLKYVGFCAEGVRVFFILSGFFMLCSKELVNGNVKNYYYKRIKRIVPVYYFVLTIYVILGVLNVFPWPADETGLYWIRYYLFLNTSIPAKEYYWFNLGGTWTISYFVLFYLLAPVMYKYLNSWKRCIYSVIPILVIGALFPNGIVEPLNGLSFFVIGMIIYHAILENKIINTGLYLIVVGMAFIIPGRAYPYGDGFILGAMVLCMLSLGEKEEIKLIKPVIDFVNDHSYTIYLVHMLAIIIFADILGFTGMLFILVVVCFTMFVSWIIDKFMNCLVG